MWTKRVTGAVKILLTESGFLFLGFSSIERKIMKSFEYLLSSETNSRYTLTPVMKPGRYCVCYFTYCCTDYSNSSWTSRLVLSRFYHVVTFGSYTNRRTEVVMVLNWLMLILKEETWKIWTFGSDPRFPLVDWKGKQLSVRQLDS